MESFRIFTTFCFLLSWRDGWNDAPAEGRNAIPSCSGTLDDFSHWQHLATPHHCATTAFFFHSSCYVMVNYWRELSLSELLHLHISFFFIFIPKKSFCFCSLWALIWRYVLAIPPSSFEALAVAFLHVAQLRVIVFLGFYLSRADGSKWVFWHKAGKT